MTEVRDAAVHFEAVKISLKQDKSGFILTTAIHPNDVPESLLRDWVGSRYMVAMVKLDDENQPVEPPEAKAGKEAVARAAQLCKLPRFQKWLFRAGYAFEESETAAADAIKDVCQIQSRADLKTDAGARQTFDQLVDAFKKEVQG